MLSFLFLTGMDETTRFKRQIPDDEYIDYCPRESSAQRCVVFEDSCYRVLTCDTQLTNEGKDGSECKQMDHIYEDVRCCKPCCLNDDVPENNPSPPCSRKLTKEQLCPNKEFL